MQRNILWCHRVAINVGEVVKKGSLKRCAKRFTIVSGVTIASPHILLGRGLTIAQQISCSFGDKNKLWHIICLAGGGGGGGGEWLEITFYGFHSII